MLGTADAVHGGGTVRTISATFSRADLQKVYERVNSEDFQSQLRQFNCGDPVPHVVFTVSLWERGEYRERQVLLQPQPMFSPAGRERCLMFGLGYRLDLEFLSIDHGEPINYHYHNPHNGEELAPRKRDVPRTPVCDCSRRDGKEEWVTFPRPPG